MIGTAGDWFEKTFQFMINFLSMNLFFSETTRSQYIGHNSVFVYIGGDMRLYLYRLETRILLIRLKLKMMLKRPHIVISHM